MPDLSGSWGRPAPLPWSISPRAQGGGVSGSRRRASGWLRFQGRASGVRSPVSSLELGSGQGFQRKWHGRRPPLTMSRGEPGKERTVHTQAGRWQVTHMEHTRTGRRPRRLERRESTLVSVGSIQRGESLTHVYNHHQEGGPDFMFYLKTCSLCTLDFVWAGVGVGI